jgi:hypothetical protein
MNTPYISACYEIGRSSETLAGWDSVIANMIERGAPATPEEGRTIAAYLAAQFGSN